MARKFRTYLPDHLLIAPPAIDITSIGGVGITPLTSGTYNNQTIRTVLGFGNTSQSFSTTSVSYVTALDIFGGGEILGLIVNNADPLSTAGKWPNAYARLTVDNKVRCDGIVINKLSVTSIATLVGNITNTQLGTLSPAFQYGSFPFRANVKLEIRSGTAGETVSAIWLIRRYR